MGMERVHKIREFDSKMVNKVNLGERVNRGGRGRRPKGCNDDRVDELNGQGNNQGEGVNGNVEGVNGDVGGAPD
ncbi:hypothetical protein Tco_0984288, partial [Tanacetum coccineum]